MPKAIGGRIAHFYSTGAYPSGFRKGTRVKPLRMDRERLRDALRSLGKQRIYLMLDNAIDFLPMSKLHPLAEKYVDPKRLSPTEDPPRGVDRDCAHHRVPSATRIPRLCRGNVVPTG